MSFPVHLGLVFVLRGRGARVWCAPKLWEGKQWTLQIQHRSNGTDITESTSTFSVDVTGQRKRSDESGTRNGKQYHIKYLWYYPANTLYMVHDGICEMHFLQGNFSQECHNLPDPNAAEFVNENIGPFGPNTLHTWGTRGMMPDGTGYFYTVDIQPAPGYLPVMTESQGLGIEEGVPTYTVTAFYECWPGIRDPNVFSVPKECLNCTRGGPCPTLFGVRPICLRPADGLCRSSTPTRGQKFGERTSQLSVDFIGQRLASRETGVRQGKSYEVFNLYYYPANTLFQLEGDVCKTYSLSGNMSNGCFYYPYENVKEYLREALGSFSTEYGLWTGGIRGEKEGIGVFSSFSQGQPVPLMEEQQGVIDGVPTYTVSNYYDVTFGIQDPRIFTPPSACVQ